MVGISGNARWFFVGKDKTPLMCESLTIIKIMKKKHSEIPLTNSAAEMLRDFFWTITV